MKNVRPTVLFGMDKQATRWKELLRAGRLGGRSLSRIFDAAGVEKKITTSGKDYLGTIKKLWKSEGRRATWGPESRGVSSAIRRLGQRYSPYTEHTGGSAIARFADIVKANAHGLKVPAGVGGNDRTVPAVVDSMRNKRTTKGAVKAYKATNRQRMLDDTFANVQMYNKSRADGLIRDLTHGLKKDSGPQTMDHGLYPAYRELVTDRNKLPITPTKQFIREIRTGKREPVTIDSIFGGKKTIQPREYTPREQKMMDMVKQEFALAPKRKTHTLSGISSTIFPKEDFKGKSTLEQMEMLMKAGPDGEPLLPSPHYNSMTKTVVAPLGIGSGITRHEIAHGLFDRGDTAYRVGVIKDINGMVRRNPDIGKAIQNSDYTGTLLNEAAAQVIAARGGSRSAKRFIAAENQYARDFIPRNETRTQKGLFGREETITRQRGNSNLASIMDRVNKADPTGVDGAIIPQLVTNYMLDIPKPKIRR